ncbi:hypothetical protein BABINDRAFT_7835 [Babjeviella inositovora NRRL Y-12698]|uniref:PPIase cyclophilin-type domain-containing protein n=1 Tax=Babjeviella inositovora NRRL Y-12698 TaxID=984486 RepID=A0A1E3QRU6_9ASCO|nr:uncharacterized protein BABINDRAFT_7835 [Babjeviella inositovora NRRL Y-12698]ODQ80401.1 hypothetical protein BABINDRAFT_7835 [Babjeviella inositovora NRRL Y-12698]
MSYKRTKARVVLYATKSENEATLILEVEPTAIGDAFLGYCTDTENRPSFLNSQVSRLVAPEFIIQLGEIPGLTLSFDREGLSKTETGIVFHTAPRLGYVYAAQSASSTQFFVTLKNIEKYAKELSFSENYAYIGKVIKGFTKLVEWLPQIPVDDEHKPLEDIHIVDCCVVPEISSSTRGVRSARDVRDSRHQDSRSNKSHRSRSKSPGHGN